MRLLAPFTVLDLGSFITAPYAAMLLAALGIIGDLLSGQRIMLQRTFERVRRIELELGVPPSHYEPGARPTGHEPTTGAHAGRRGSTEEREAVKL